MLTKADKTLRPFLALGAFAGLRTAELQRLDWKEIDLDRGFITVDANKAKTRQRRLVPISDNLKLWLMPCKQASGPVCLHQRPQIAAARLCEGFVGQENGPRQRGLRSDVVTLCICPQMLPCRRPSAGWCAREHGVSRQYAYRLQQDFSRELADYIRFRGQRFKLRARDAN